MTLSDERLTHAMELRVQKYEVLDYLNQMTNTILSGVPQGDTRDTLLMDLKRAKELVNNI